MKNTTKQKSFSKLSNAEKRVTIAKDVLKQLKSERLIAKAGVYFKSKDAEDLLEKYWHTYTDETSTPELSDIIKDKPCTVCGIGSLFVCAVDRLDKLKITGSDYIGSAKNINSNDIHEYLKKFFSAQQLELIEYVFERGMAGHPNISAKQYDVSEKYLRDIESPTKRMEAIMRNIIRNKGIFTLPKKYYTAK